MKYILPHKIFASLIGCLIILAGACSPEPEVPPDYRLDLGDKQLTFEQQMIYLVYALEIYRLHVGAYPSEANNLEALIAQPGILEASGSWMGPYAESDIFFKDPWQRKISYKLTEDNMIDLRSLGKDGVVSDDDLAALEMFPNWAREAEKLSKMAPVIVPSATK